MFDELAIWKGIPFYTGAFYPPTAPYNLTGNSVYLRKPTVPMGTQDSPTIVDVDDIPEIGAGNFTISLDFYIEHIFEWITYPSGNNHTQIYYLAVQLDQDADGNILLPKNGWLAYLKYNTDYTVDVYFEVWVAGTLVTQLTHMVDITWGTFTDSTADNQSESYVNITVSRSGDVARLFVDGTYSDEATATAALIDFTPSTGDLQSNGMIGVDATDQPLSSVSIRSFFIYDGAYNWADFTPSEVRYDQLPGLAFYPRIKINMYLGAAGDVNADLPFTMRVDGLLRQRNLSETLGESLTVNDSLSSSCPHSEYTLITNTNQGIT